MFQQLSQKVVQAWKDVWHTEPFQKIGWLSHIHPTYHWLEDVIKQIREGIREFGESTPPQFTLQTKRRALRNGESRETTERVAILTTCTKTLALKTMISTLYRQRMVPGQWRPLGIHLQRDGQESYSLSREHEDSLYLWN